MKNLTFSTFSLFSNQVDDVFVIDTPDKCPLILRHSPGKNGEVMYCMRNGQEVLLLSDLGDGWSHVAYINDHDPEPKIMFGFCANKYIKGGYKLSCIPKNSSIMNVICQS